MNHGHPGFVLDDNNFGSDYEESSDFAGNDSSHLAGSAGVKRGQNLMHIDVLKILKKQDEDCDCGTQMRFVYNFILLGWYFNHKIED